MPFGFRKEGEEQQRFKTNIMDKEDLKKLTKMSSYW
jgi:hypothetical protein